MRNNVDLHIHTNASDGSYTPVEVVALMKDKVDCLAITDHDSVAALKIARRECEKNGLEFVSGIEISTGDFGGLHILGYFIHEEADSIVHYTESINRERVLLFMKLTRFAKKHGIQLPDDIMVATRMEIESYFSKQNLEVPELYHLLVKHKISAQTAIHCIKQAGGISVLAHPGRIDNEYSLESILVKLKAVGLDGMECFHPCQSGKSESFLKLAQKYQLIVTGGSDFHTLEQMNKQTKYSYTQFMDMKEQVTYLRFAK